MPNSTVWLRGIAALVGAIIVATPLSAQVQCANGLNCKRPVAGTNVSTVYRYKTVQRVSNVNRYRNVTRTSYNDITRTKYRDIHQVKYRDVTRTHYVRHINRIVTVTRVHTRDPPSACRDYSAGPYSHRGSEPEPIRVGNQDAADPHRDSGIADRH